jgi:methylamine---glutamate N-methyltransferase subunit A
MKEPVAAQFRILLVYGKNTGRIHMCGIVGYLNKAGECNTTGNTLLGMLNALACRGPDSAGVALFGEHQPNQFVAQIKLGDDGNGAGRAREIKAIAEKFGARDFRQTGSYFRFVFRETEDLKPFIVSVEAVGKDIEVVSVGRSLEIVKQVGSPSLLEKTFGISGFRAEHGIGHTRLSTESVVDLSHSQPFWSHGYPDLAIAHNGHITNYHQLRRRYEQGGTRFYTENDSEIVAVFLADKLRQGADLRAAMESMITELDGSFSCVVATESALGFVKDTFSFKPLVFTETDRFVAVATEEIAIRGAIQGDFVVQEAQAKEVRIWRR